MAETNDITTRLVALQQQFAIHLTSRLDELAQCITSQGPDIAHATLEDVRSRLHKLAGSAGTFGFTELSFEARQLEIISQDWITGKSAPSLSQWNNWQLRVLALRNKINEPAGTAAIKLSAQIVAADENRRVRIAVIGDNAMLREELEVGLSQFDYEISLYGDYTSAGSALLASPADVLIVESLLNNRESEFGHNTLNRIFDTLGYRIPMICITTHSDFETRLAAARAGSDALVSKPVDIPALAEHIERLLRERQISPYRVLIVDDDEFLAEHYRLVLCAAGMRAEKICQPRLVMNAIEHLNPDILLLDLHMPECSGTELARVIRYENELAGLPIVFLSAESDLERQIEALSSGGDDFLTKPISDVRLVAAVRARAARARKISELMNQDSLTGLLKHASIKERLKQEVDRAQRQQKPLTVAMIDIDHFKQVNDVRGHPMGDKVIKTLAQLLRQRLRRQDSIGRYGGEEFAAILPECSLENALNIIDDIRQRMAAMHFTKDGENFSVTLSAGIVSTEHYFEATSLLAAADAALYSAKHSGRNRVVCD